jgi:hypothetical protein
MKKNSRFCLTVLSVGILISHSAYADSQALKDLKIHIGSVQRVLTDPRLAEREHRDERRRIALAVLHQVLIFAKCRAAHLERMRVDTVIGWKNSRRSSLICRSECT